MTTDLFLTLAEARSRHADITRVHNSATAQLTTAISGITAELDRLRSTAPQWLGKDQAIERKYMRLLEQRRQLQQSYAMSSPAPAAPEEVEPELRKAIEYGRLLLDIYGGGMLVKSAAGDVQRWGEKLIESGNSEAWAIGRELLKGAKVQRVLKWQGFAIGVEYLPGDVRFKGSGHERKLKASGYGHFRNYVGADNEALDCYLFTGFFREIDDDEPSDNIFEVSQLNSEGRFDEHKYMVGWNDLEEAKRVYLMEMPKRFFGGIRQVAIEDLEQYKK